MSAEQEIENKCGLSTDTITEVSLDLSRGITDDDKILWRKDKNAVDFSLNYAKLWCKFCKDLVVALEKKASIEIESSRSLSKQIQALDSTISSSSMVGSPLRSETLAMSKLIIDQCKEIEIQNSKRLGKLLDVINRQRTEFSKTRKHYKDKWKSDCKRMSDAENYMLKTRSSYYQRCQQGVKLREDLTSSQSLLTYMLDHGIQDSVPVPTATTIASQSSSANTSNDNFGSSTALPGSVANPNDAISASQLSKQKVKVDKLEKQLADNDKKEIEMMYLYKESVETANNRLIEFEKKKLEHLCDIRLTTARNDEVVKDTLAEYFRILFETRTTMLKEYSLLSEKFQEYKPCQELKNLIEKHASNKPDVYSEKFQVELFHDSAAAKEKSESQAAKSMSIFGIGAKESEHDSSHRSTSGNRTTLASHSDSDSDSEIISVNEPCGPSGSKGAGVLNTIVEFGSNLFRQGQGNTTGGTQFESRRTQSQLKSKKSTSGSTSSMTGNTEGNTNEKDIEWQKEVEAAIEIILKCIEIIELNGLTTHGIYRVSASKLKVGLVIDSLNSQGLEANLENELPITLASVVKSKFMQLSEPLIPYNQYAEFVELGKEAELGDGSDLILKLRSLVSQLPSINKKLAGLIFHHLKRIANNSEENQMGSTNLGTLFAPTLIKAKPRFRMADIKEYMDNKSQAKIVQLMIENVEEFFGSADQYYVLCKSNSENNGDIEKNQTFSSKTDSSNKILRPRSSIIESLDSLETKNDSPSTRPLSGSFMLPSNQSMSQNSNSKVISEKPAPKLMEMLLGPEASNNIQASSPRLRERKKTTNYEMEKSFVSETNTSENVSSITPQRSISVGSGPSPDSIKLVQLSQPSNDSIFSKSKEIDNSTSIERTVSLNTGERSSVLKKSFLASHESKTMIKRTDATPNTVTTESKHSSVRNSQVSALSRPATSTTRSHFSYSNDFELPSECDSCNEPYNTLVQSQLSFDPIFEYAYSFETKHFIDNCTERPYKLRSYSHASPSEINIFRHKMNSYSYSPFIRQSNFRTPFVVRSLSDLRISSPLQNSNILRPSFSNVNSSKISRNTKIKLKKFCSVDNIECPNNSDINRQIAKYQLWLSEPVSSEFFV